MGLYSVTIFFGDPFLKASERSPKANGDGPPDEFMFVVPAFYIGRLPSSMPDEAARCVPTSCTTEPRKV